MAWTVIDVVQWADAMAAFVENHAALPERSSLAKLELYVAQVHAASPKMPEGEGQKRAISLVYLWSVSVKEMKLEMKEKQAFVSAAQELISSLIASNSPMINKQVLVIIQQCGQALCGLGLAREAVALARRLKPLVEVQAAAVEHSEPELSLFLSEYARWLLEAAKPFSSGPEAQRLADRQELLLESGVMFERAISLAEACRPPGPHLVELVDLYNNQALTLGALGAYDVAVKVARRGMQIPSVSFSDYVFLARLAIDSLVNLRRDTQAEALIEDILARARHAPRSPPVRPFAMERILQNHSMILCRRGMLNKALAAITKAIQLLKQNMASVVSEAQLEQVQSLLGTANMEMAELLSRMGPSKLGALNAVEQQELGSMALYRPACVMRSASFHLAAGQKGMALEALRFYTQSYDNGGTAWAMRDRWAEGNAVKPLEMLRDLLEEGDEERAKVEAVIQRTTAADEALRQETLEELQREMRAGRGEAAGPSKASKKKRKKRERKRQQRRDSQAGGGMEDAGAVADLAGLSLEEEQAPVQGGGVAEAAGAAEEEDDDECPMCLRPFKEAEGTEEGEEEVLGCGHRYHDVCMDRWLCKCKEKGLPPTCPTCRREVVRGAGSAGGAR